MMDNIARGYACWCADRWFELAMVGLGVVEVLVIGWLVYLQLRYGRRD